MSGGRSLVVTALNPLHDGSTHSLLWLTARWSTEKKIHLTKVAPNESLHAMQLESLSDNKHMGVSGLVWFGFMAYQPLLVI